MNLVRLEIDAQPFAIHGDMTEVGAEMVARLLRPAVLQLMAEVPVPGQVPLVAGLFAGLLGIAHFTIGKEQAVEMMELFTKATRDYEPPPPQGGH